ncbi:MAG: hypothetical protein PHQ60_16380 [Sideroxydans sp.]|nr:hypothetical protein [Sideroxydans sp.]
MSNGIAWYAGLPVDCLPPALVLRDEQIAELTAEVERLRVVASAAQSVVSASRLGTLGELDDALAALRTALASTGGAKEVARD